VSEKDPKLTPQEPSSSLPSSGLPASDRSLERVLGALDKTLKSFETVLSMVYGEVTSQGKLNMARHEMAVKLLGKIRVELATLTDQLRNLLTSNNIQLGATVEARDALVRTRDKLEDAAKKMHDATGQQALLKPEDEEGKAPLAVRQAVVKLANFAWPIAVRSGKDAVVWGVKLVTGFISLGGLGKIIHMLLTGHLQ